MDDQRSVMIALVDELVANGVDLSGLIEALKDGRGRQVELRVPNAATLRRRKEKAMRAFPVICRNNQEYLENDGRVYGEVTTSSQQQADAGFWRVGDAVRKAKMPMTVAVNEKVVRIWEVESWTRNPDSGKWSAQFGKQLTNADLNRDWPDYPYRIGDTCKRPNSRSAYHPEYF